MKRLAAVTAAALLLAACGTGEPNPSAADVQPAEVPQTADPTPIATPTATSTPTVTETPEPAAVPEPTPKMRQGVCPSARENGGLAYEFDLDEMGWQEAVDSFCGPVPPPSAWITFTEIDELTGAQIMFADSWAVEHDVPWPYDRDTPFLRILCLSNDTNSDLAVFVDLGGMPVIGYRDGLISRDAKVIYRFDDNPLIEDYWEVGDRELVILYRNKYRSFVRSLRGADNLILRAWAFRDEAYTMTFDLAGVERDVDPVLQECGY